VCVCVPGCQGVEAKEGVAVGWGTMELQNLNASKANIKTHTHIHSHTELLHGRQNTGGPTHV